MNHFRDALKAEEKVREILASVVRESNYSIDWKSVGMKLLDGFPPKGRSPSVSDIGQFEDFWDLHGESIRKRLSLPIRANMRTILKTIFLRQFLIGPEVAGGS